MKPARPPLFSDAGVPGAGEGASLGWVRWLWIGGSVLAAFVGVVLRWYHLGWQSLWFDEGYSAWVASLSPGEIVRVIRVDTAPPLYYLLLHGWGLWAGHSEARLRTLSALCSTAALGVGAMVACRLFHRPSARAVALAGVAVSSMQVGYAHEVRFYEMMALAGVADFYLMLRACETEAGSFSWVAAAAGTAAVSLWLNNLMAMELGFLALAWLVAPGRRPMRGRVLDVSIVGVAAGLVYAPWAAVAMSQAAAVGGRFWIARPGGHDLLRMFAQVAGVDHAGEHLLGRTLFNILVFAVAALLLVAAVWGERRRAAAALAIYGLLPVLFVFCISQGPRSLFIDRAFIVSSVVAPMLLAVPFESVPAAMRRGMLPQLGWGIASGGLVALVLVAAGQSCVSERQGIVYHRELWRDVCRYVGGPSTRRGLLVFNGNEGELMYDFYARHGDYSPAPWITGTPSDFFAGRPPRAMQRVENQAALNPLRTLLMEHAADPVVLVSAHQRVSPGETDLTLRLLQQQRPTVEERTFSDITVYRFAPQPTPAGR